MFSSLKKTINGIIRSNDILSDTSLVNVQSLLIISNVGDLHGSVGSGGSVGACSVRLGVAIRMVRPPTPSFLSLKSFKSERNRSDLLFRLSGSLWHLLQAQDLGLHRDEIKATLEMTDHDRMEERAFLELKRRVWAGCVVMDRWCVAGNPLALCLSHSRAVG